jgi:uncharacterized repeat protein (TIGR03803 family)
MTPGGKLTTLHSFCSQLNSSGYCADGCYPFAGLVLASNGDFYGTTVDGGTNNGGTVFKITASGKLTTLYNFCSQTDCTDGESPFAGLIQASDGNFYGTTENGGEYNRSGGTVFQITPSGKLTMLYSRCSQTDCADGSQPLAGLVQAGDGNFYGTTWLGGAHGEGTVFSLSLARVYRVRDENGDLSLIF